MQKHLTFKQKILVAGTLFGMFFGAGNLIFPVHLGQLAGRNVIPAMIGFIITAVGIPIMGVAAIGNTHSDGLQQLSNKVGKGYGYVFSCLLYLTIGPGFAIPRCATTSFTVGVAPMLSAGASESIALLIFSVIFFAIVLILSLRPGEITVWIGKVITPIFLVFLAILVVTALINPSTSVSDVEPAAGYQTGALSLGFIEGYNTMDAIAGLAFGIVVIDIIRSMGVTDDSDVAKDVLSSGLLTSIPMIVIYVTTILMGTQSRGLFETSENGGIALAQISGHYLGRAGSLVLAVTITCACLKTAIGLVTSCSDAFSRMFPKGLSYRAWAVIFTVLSFLIQFRSVQDHQLFPAAAAVPVPAGDHPDSAGAVRESVPSRPGCLCQRHGLHLHRRPVRSGQGAARESENRPSSGRRGRPCGEDSPLLRHQPGLGSPRLCGSRPGSGYSLCEKAEGRLMLT